MKIKTLTILCLFLFSCNKEESSLPISEEIETVLACDIDEASILPEAKEFYQNIAIMAEWYSNNPEVLKSCKTKSANTSDSTNTIISKLESLDLSDSQGKKVSLFSLDKKNLKLFLNQFILIESQQLSNKLLKDSSKMSENYIKTINLAFSQSYPNPSHLKSSKEDPYWRVLNRLKILYNQTSIKSTLPYSADDTLLLKAMASKSTSSSVIQTAPNRLSPQVFVSRIKKSLSKGRLLISLPGGWNTSSPIVFYENKQWYDIGHVAIISKNSNEIPTSIPDNYSLTISTNPYNGTHHETIKSAWSEKHGISFVGQVYDVKWKWYYKKWNDWGWKKELVDVNNTKIYNKALEVIGTPYCTPLEIITAKWTAPKRFICSSMAWWCIKEANDVNIGDWWKPSIFPAGVYLSDRVRIIDTTID